VKTEFRLNEKETTAVVAAHLNDSMGVGENGILN
jgi:hypothetical protein